MGSWRIGLDMGHRNQRIFERQGRWIMRLRGAILLQKGVSTSKAKHVLLKQF